MDLSTAVNGMLTVRNALCSPEGISSPTFISRKIQTLAQYVGVIEIILGEKEESLSLQEAKIYKAYLAKGMKPTPAKELAKADLVVEHAENTKLARYISSSWKIVSTSQSRIRHLIEESKNQI